jgi:hypothetical protein
LFLSVTGARWHRKKTKKPKNKPPLPPIAISYEKYPVNSGKKKERRKRKKQDRFTMLVLSLSSLQVQQGPHCSPVETFIQLR